ncbi:hypothetical protein niasHS_015812 [Heterodera schachtii]|uniref:Uncharacterized protein n=1 Tax=Heterodera schachtii TaxID=97005 RepID=A0ABD2I1M9_HETSC
MFVHQRIETERNQCQFEAELKTVKKGEMCIQKNHFVRPNSEPIFNLDATPELGIFGCLVGNTLTGEVSFFSRTGHMMKTKMAHVNEGGVWRGASVYDSPYLV